jgi:hypothetical protein
MYNPGYVGKTVAFAERYNSHRRQQNSNYRNLNRGSTSFVMIALCLLDLLAEDGL